MRTPLKRTDIRQFFPICQHTTYLASCSCGALALPVKQAVETFLRDWGAQGPQWEQDWYDAVLRAEQLFAALLPGAQENEVVFLPSVSSGVATIASAFHTGTLAEWGSRTHILIPAGEFPTTGQIWLKQPGLRLIDMPADTDDLAPYLDAQTLLVAFSHVCYASGLRRNLAALTAQAHQAGALVFIDDSQSAGTRPVDVAALGIDLLIASGHKYLLGLPGAGAFLYVRQPLIERLAPTLSGWAAHRDFVRGIAEQHGRLHIIPGSEGWNPLAFEYAPDAWRFAGGTANITGAYAAKAALELVREMDPATLAEQIERLTTSFIAGCQELGIAIKTPLAPEQRGPMVVIRCSQPEAFAARLAEARILVSPRGADGLRIAFHGYNTEEDVCQVLAALSTCQKWLSAP